MATKIKGNVRLMNCMALVAKLMGPSPLGQMWVDYDEEADVLYVSFRKPQRATRTVEAEDDLLIRKDGGRVVGLTILHASTR